MEVQINSCTIDYELENEETVSDVIGGVQKWLSERDLVFVEAEIDDQNYLIDNIPNSPLSGVGRINCMVQSKADIVISSLNSAIAYSSRVIDSINNSNIKKSNIIELSDGIDWLLSVLHKCMELLSIDENSVRYKDGTMSGYRAFLINIKNDLKAVAKEEDAALLLNKHAEVFISLREIFKMIMESKELNLLILNSIDSPDVLLKSLLEMKNEIPAELKNIEETAASYQTGKDSEASGKLHRFIDFFYRYSRMCHQISIVFNIDFNEISFDGDSLEGKNNKLMEYIGEIANSFENNDIINLSDLLEYEIVPIINTLGKFLDLIEYRILDKDY